MECFFGVIESYWFKFEVVLTAVNGTSSAPYLLRKKVTRVPCAYGFKTIAKISCKFIE